MSNPSFQNRTTRSGKVFNTIADSPTIRIQPVHCESTFDIAALLKAAFELEERGEAEENLNYFNPDNELEESGRVRENPNYFNPDHENFRSVLVDTTQPEDTTVEPPSKKQKRSHEHRQAGRAAAVACNGHRDNPKAVYHYVDGGKAFAIDIPIALDQLPATSCGYRAKAKKTTRKVVHADVHYKETKKFRELAWDGKKTIPLVQAGTGKIFGVLVAPPQDDGAKDTKPYMQSVEDAFEAMERARMATEFKPEESEHQRGPFPAVNDGLYYGQGSTEPHRLNTGPHKEIIEELRNNPDIKRMAAFASSALSIWAPKLHEFYQEKQSALLEKMPHLKPNFERSVFATAAYNFGPIVCTYPHTDCMNFPAGLCAVQSMGHFDPTKGGHLVLEELELIIQFPPGCLILLPSALLTHANTPVQAHERRTSFTQYTPGGLIRFVDNDFQTEAQLKASLTKDEYEKRMAEKKTRWSEGLARWSTMDELVSRAKESLDAHEKMKAEKNETQKHSAKGPAVKGRKSKAKARLGLL